MASFSGHPAVSSTPASDGGLIKRSGSDEMIFGLFRKKPHEELVGRLHEKIVAQSRLPAFFLPPYGVPDTLVGRFELLTLNAGLVLRRLNQPPEPGPEIAQGLSNAIF